MKTKSITYRKSRCISRVFETTNRAKLLDLDFILSPNQYEVSLKIQDVVLDFRGSTYTKNRLIHRDLR